MSASTTSSTTVAPIWSLLFLYSVCLVAECVLLCVLHYLFFQFSGLPYNLLQCVSCPSEVFAMSLFKYDIVTLIELVETKPCLWDKSHEGNKIKILRQRCWKEIFEYLEDGYDTLNTEEKKKVGKY